MPYSHVTRTRNGAEAIQYCRGEGKGHNQNAERNQYIFGVNMLPDDVVPFERQMQPFGNRADSRHKIQIDRYVISFSPDELDPERPEDVLMAEAMLTEFAREYLPGHQVAVFIQTDGKGGRYTDTWRQMMFTWKRVRAWIQNAMPIFIWKRNWTNSVNSILIWQSGSRCRKRKVSTSGVCVRKIPR